MSNDTWEFIGNLMIYATAITAALFAIGYGLLAPWWRTPTGRNIFWVMSMLSVVAVYFGWRVYIGRVPVGFFPVRALLFTVLWMGMLHRLILFIRVQIRGRRLKRELENTR